MAVVVARYRYRFVSVKVVGVDVVIVADIVIGPVTDIIGIDPVIVIP